MGRNKRSHCLRGHIRNAESITPRGNCKECLKIQKLVSQRLHQTEYSLKYRGRYRKSAVERSRRYQERNPEKVSLWKTVSQQRRRARKRNSEGTFTAHQWANLKRFFSGMCLCCKRTESELVPLGRVLSPDHIRPLAKGGSNDITNIQPLCLGRDGCNNHKAVRWIDYRGGFVLEIC